jgi:hypothetical protein
MLKVVKFFSACCGKQRIWKSSQQALIWLNVVRDFTVCDTRIFGNSLREPPVMESAPPVYYFLSHTHTHAHTHTQASTLQQNSRKLFHIYIFFFFLCVSFLGLCAGRTLLSPQLPISKHIVAREDVDPPRKLRGMRVHL